MIDGIEVFPVLGQQLVEPAHGMSVRHAFENVLEIGIALSLAVSVDLGLTN